MAGACTPHQCPHCRCLWELRDDMGRVDTTAPFYGLVMEIAGMDHVDPRGIRIGGERGRYSARRGWRQGGEPPHATRSP